MQHGLKLRGVDIMTPEQATELHSAMVKCLFGNQGPKNPEDSRPLGPYVNRASSLIKGSCCLAGCYSAKKDTE